jgi:segregation and condensation protein B
VGHRDVPGKPELLGTTRDFLNYFGLKKLDDLPTLTQLKELEDLRVQLSLPSADPILAAHGVEGERAGEIEVEVDSDAVADSVAPAEDEDEEQEKNAGEQRREQGLVARGAADDRMG